MFKDKAYYKAKIKETAIMFLVGFGFTAFMMFLMVVCN